MALQSHQSQGWGCLAQAGWKGQQRSCAEHRAAGGHLSGEGLLPEPAFCPMLWLCSSEHWGICSLVSVGASLCCTACAGCLHPQVLVMEREVQPFTQPATLWLC